MIDNIIKKEFAEKYRLETINGAMFLHNYYIIEDKYIFVPFIITQDHIEEYRRIMNLKFSDANIIPMLLDKVVLEVASLIQSKLLNHDYLKIDIYLFVEVDKTLINFQDEDIIKLENDKFCCRKIVFQYNSNNNLIEEADIIENLKKIEAGLEKQFENKFLFNRVYEKFITSFANLSEENIVKSVINDETSNNYMISLEHFGLKDFKTKLSEIYNKYNINEGAL